MGIFRPILNRPQIGNEINSGNQGSIFELRGLPDLVYKEYFSDVSTNERGFSALVSLPSRASISDRSIFLTRSCWPTTYVRPAGGSVLGCVMPRIPETFYATVRGDKWEKHSQFLHTEVKNLGITMPSDQERLQIVISFLEFVEVAHKNGIAIGDISHNNVLWTLSGAEGEPQVYFIDCDSMRVIGERPPVPQGDTPGWSLPKEQRALGENLPSDERGLDADLYKVGLFVLRTLLKRTDEATLFKEVCEGDALMEFFKSLSAKGSPFRLARYRHVRDLYLSSQQNALNRPSAADWKYSLTQSRLFG